ncbi:hypothetical protein AAG906_037469 [Vitis piasezkii]
MGWLPMVTVLELIFSTLVRAFYLRMTYGIGGPIISTVRGVEIQLDLESIYRIFDIAPIGLKRMGKPSAHSLTMINRVLHHMICSILLPQGGHKDEVSYYEEFLVDSIRTRRRIHLGYLMMMHMISCCKSMTHVLLYGRVFKDVGVDWSRETDFEAPNIYDTYDEQSLGRMKFEKALDDLKFDIPPLQSKGVQFEAIFSKPMMSELTYIAGPSSQPSFTEPPHIEIPPHQAPHALNHALWMDHLLN